MERPSVGLVAAVMIASLGFLPPMRAEAIVPNRAAAPSAHPIGEAPAIEQVAVCYGVGWRGLGYYPSLLGLRPACWDTLPYTGPVAPTPAYIAVPPSPVWYYCDNPRGYYPSVPACATGWRAVPRQP
jgi:hypothetical protein